MSRQQALGEQTFEWEGAERLARSLLQIKAVEIHPENPFTWSSGWKSPIYCDNRMILGYPLCFDQVERGFIKAISELTPGVDVIAGTATAGIPHAAAVARVLKLPMAYVRGSAKGHGKQKQVEGRIGAGLSAVVIEDTLSTGRSAFEAVEALRAEGMDVLAVFSIFSYDFAISREKAEAAEIPAHRLLGFDTLISTAVAESYVDKSYLEVLQNWRLHPEQFGG
ncbi:orotate phosphoribosyltransferase [Alicyclobacillus curvatus]|jgi:orotate phosphoribosyltransferase|nr:orotate phosphoribosyltransferase [Alicyclobacillus curvatus]